MRREGTRVRFLRSVYVPEDDACFQLYEAASAEAVREAAERAELSFAGLTEVVAERSEGE
jgi:hypothetical protein